MRVVSRQIIIDRYLNFFSAFVLLQPLDISTLRPGVRIIKFFSLLLKVGQNKLECILKFFKACLKFKINATTLFKECHIDRLQDLLKKYLINLIND